MLKNNIYKKILNIIKEYDEIVIARHISPDPDAIGSQIGLRDAIRLAYPEKKVYAIGAGVHRFKYIGTLDKINLTDLHNALLVVLDVPNFSRIDGIEELDYKAILKIDHHPREDIIGDVDWTDETKSSACEMVANLVMNTKLTLSESVAKALYIGIVSDSERFMLRNTRIDTFKTVYDLLSVSKIDFVSLYNNMYERSIDEEKFRAYLANNIKISENGFGFIYVTNDILKKFNVDSASVSNLVNNFHFIKELIGWMFVVYDERNEVYKANIRSRGPIINTIANKYNGGGHKFASGCRTPKYEDIEALAQDLDLACKDFLDNESK